VTRQGLDCAVEAAQREFDDAEREWIDAVRVASAAEVRDGARVRELSAAAQRARAVRDQALDRAYAAHRAQEDTDD
jgi:hypothetical protein